MMSRTFGLSGNLTRLYPLSYAFVERECTPVRQMLMRWRFFNVNGFQGHYLDGRPISLVGIKFVGSPRDVFWGGLFEPYIDDVIQKSLQWTMDECTNRGLEISLYMSEMRLILREFITWAYGQMAEVDVIIRGNGFPDWKSSEVVSTKIDSMQRHLDGLIDAYTLSGDIIATSKEVLPKSISIIADRNSSVILQVGGSNNTQIVRDSLHDEFSSTEIAPAEYTQDLRSTPASATPGQLLSEEAVQRWFDALSAHGVDRARILRVFPRFSLADMTSFDSAAKVIQGEDIQKTCDLLRLNRQWLESGRGQAQQTIDVWSLIDYLASEKNRSTYVSLTWYADTERPVPGKLWHACPVVESHISELDDIEITRYAPMTRIFWSNEEARLRLFFDVLWISRQLEVPMYWSVLKNDDALSLIANGEEMTAVVIGQLNAIRSHDFHPEDMVNRRNEWGVAALFGEFEKKVNLIKSISNEKCENNCTKRPRK